MKRGFRLVVLGGPGSGKGTQGQAISKLLGLKHISTGEIFRDHIERKTQLGTLAQTYIGQGKLVPDEVATQLLEEILQQLPEADGFILDGYPRSLRQAQDLSSILEKRQCSLNAVFYLNVSDEEIVRRLSGRLVCHECGQSFHLVFQVPKVANICDHCGGALFRREDDNPETIRRRIGIFHEMTEPLIAFYRQKKLLREINAEGLPEEVKAKVETAALALVP